MVAINKMEKDAIRERFPNVYIARTMKQKSKRHKYYCEENRQVMKFLDRLRGEESNTRTKGDGFHTAGKNAR